MNKQELYPTDEEMREIVRPERAIIQSKPDVWPSERAIAKFAVDNAVKKIVEWLDTLEFYNDWGGESGKNTVEFIQANLKELIK